MKKKGKFESLAWGRQESGGVINLTSVAKDSLEEGGEVSSIHEQAGKALTLDLKILVPTAQTSELDELGIGDGLFGAIGMDGGINQWV